MTELPLRESHGGLACRWMEKMLVHGEGDRYGQPYRLLPWHREFLWRWFECDPGPGLWWYLEALIGAERGAVKTEMLAGLAHLEMVGPDPIRRPMTPIVHMAAASYEQAGELFRQAQIMAGGAKGEEISCPLAGLYDVFDGEILFADGRPGRIARVAAVAGTNEGGKGLALDTPIATPTGWTTMGDLRAGDVVFAGDGSQTTVRWASEVHQRPCYRVEFSHGDDLIADDEHRWLVEPIRHRGPARVMSTAELADNHLTGRGQTKWRIPMHGPLDTEPMEWPCDPWYVGYWLGDGTSTGGAITTADDEVLDRFRSNDHGWDVNHIARYTHGISAQWDRKRSFKVMLRDRLGILPIKRVTNAMLRSSVQQRMALLQGWIDADGHVEPRGKIELSCTYPELMVGAEELVATLGIKTTRTGTSLWLWTDLPVAWLPRKAANLKPGSTARRRAEAIRSVTPTPTVPTRCIAVDHPSETFLAGRSMHVTHNSSLVLADELAEWTGRKARLHTVLTASLTKRTPEPGRAIGISMAGVGKGTLPPRDFDPLLWRLYARGLLEADDPESRFLLDWAGAGEDWDLDDPHECREALREMRGADVTWSVDVRAREILSRKMPRNEARRLYLCQWTDTPVDSWLLELPGMWAACGAGADAHPEDGSEVVVGVDMALHSDHVGVVVAGRLSDGRVGWWSRGWAPVDGRIDHLDVFGTIAGAIATRWRIKAVTYDPRFFEIPANMLADQGVSVIEFPQSPERLVPADGLLYELVRTAELAHPSDPTLDLHAERAAWRETERGRFLAKSRSGGHMDLIRAGSMATYELLMGDGPAERHEAVSLAPQSGDDGDFWRPRGRLNL